MLGGFGIAISVTQVGAAVLGRRRHRPASPPSCWPCCSACRPCGCGPTTWRSSRSRPPRALRLLFRSVSATPVTGGTRGPLGVQRRLPRAGPVGHQRPLQHPRHALERRRAVGGHSSAGRWSSSRQPAGLGAGAQPVGPGASRPSARTRTPPARWARTSTSTRCSRWSSAVVFGALGGMVYAVGTGSAQPDQYQNANTFLAYARTDPRRRGHGARPDHRGDAAAVHHRSSPTPRSRALIGNGRHPRQALLVRDRRRPDPLRPRRRRAHAVDDLPAAGHLR